MAGTTLKSIISSLGGNLVSIASSGTIPQLAVDNCKLITGVASPTTEDDARNAEGIYTGTGVTNHGLVNPIILNEDDKRAPSSIAGYLWLAMASATYAVSCVTPPKTIVHGLCQEPQASESQRLPSAVGGIWPAIGRVWRVRPDHEGNAEITLPVTKRTVYKVGSVFLWFCDPVTVPLRNASAILAAVSTPAVTEVSAGVAGDSLAGIMFESAT